MLVTSDEERLRLEARAAAAADPRGVAAGVAAEARHVARRARTHAREGVGTRTQGRRRRERGDSRMREEAPIYALDRDDPNCDD